MLRKRTSIKPNLKQIPVAQASTKTAQQKLIVNSSQCPSDTPSEPPTKIVGDELTPVSPPTSAPAVHSSTLIPASNNIAINDHLVQEAISQLTSQKLEPIKSLKLPNKNVKLRDLLFVNPPLTKDQKKHRKQNKPKFQQQAKDKQAAKVASKSNSDNDATNDNNDTQDEHCLIPKVKVGPDNTLILDESSTIITRKNSIKEQEAIVEDNEDIICKTNYDSFRRRPTRTSQTKWSPEDTTKFYKAMTICGTDFSMMESLLFSGARSRTELHKKFKREERINKKKVDIALSNIISVNSEELDNLKEML